MKLTGDEEALIHAALGSHIAALEAFLSDVEDGDDVETVRGELADAKALRARFKP
jgi:putative ubiquitin-RnfH superfamily antitoxin RatB of RatAB toxin-antitoxin module